MRALLVLAWDFTRPFFRLALIGAACFMLAAFISPQFLLSLNSVDGSRASLEICVRVYLGITIVSTLAVTALLSWQRYSKLQRAVWWACAAVTATVLFVFTADHDNLLMVEMSWIRYPTALALAAAGLIALRNVVRARSDGASFRQYFVFGVLGFGFLFAGADEVFRVHERVSLALGEITKHPSATNDLMSVVYALVGGGVLFALWHWFIRAPKTSAGSEATTSRWTLSSTCIRGLFAGVFVFGVSQACDSLDIFFLQGLRAVASSLASWGHRFPDFWFAMYSPIHIINSLEEILELTAAVMFLFFTWRSSRDGSDQEQVPAESTSPTLPWNLARAGFVTLALVLIITGWSAATTGSPLRGENAVVTAAASRRVPFKDLDPKLLDVALADRTVAPSGIELSVEGSEVIRRADGSPVRMPTRLMFRVLAGTALDREETLVFATSSGQGSFVPHMLWRVDNDE